MDFLVMLEECTDSTPVLARVDSVPAQMSPERRERDVVTLYGVPRTESLALAIAAAMESRRTADDGSAAFRHLGVWPERGAGGNTAWRDETTGDLRSRDLNIPLEVLRSVSHHVLAQFGSAMQRLVAGLSMPDWPEGAWRAISITLDPVAEPARGALNKLDGLLDVFREADGLTYEYEGD